MPSINFNPAGITALDNFNLAQTSLSVTQSQIATGKKLQSAQDDPAALATSQRLMAQINGLSSGIDNSKSANQLLSTGDQALSSMEDILQNMRQLAVKASNDATTDTDRKNYQTQINDYRAQIDEIARDTKYKERHLLNGDMKNSRAATDAKATVMTNVAVSESSTQGTAASYLVNASATTGSIAAANTHDITFQVKLVANGANVDAVVYASDSSVSVGTVSSVNTAAGATGALANYGNLNISINKVDASVDIGKTAVVRIKSQDTGDTTDKSVSFQVGANAGEEMGIGIGDMSSNGLRITSLDVSTSLAAKNSVSMIDDAINSISNERSKIGSLQNRLKGNISNNQSYQANLQSAQADVSDVNYAQAILDQTTNQIKQQASLAMITQANTSQQAVLGLLR